MDFFVYVIESPSARDLYQGISEGSRLARMLELDEVRCEVRMAINRQTFVEALVPGFAEAIGKHKNRRAFLHLSAHGGERGIELADGTSLEWSRLRECLGVINCMLHGELLLSLSACEGYGAREMAIYSDGERSPYQAMIANGSKPTWAQTAVGYLTFYHLLSTGYKLTGAVDAMKVASGDPAWVIETAEEIRTAHRRYSTSKRAWKEVQKELAATLFRRV